MAAEATLVPEDDGVAGGGGLGFGAAGPGKPDQVSAGELGAIRREIETLNRSMLIRHPIWTIVIAILTAWLVLTLLGWIMTLTGFALLRTTPQY
jgi:hypothetical protein